MKVPVLSSLILLLGLSCQLSAIERPKSLDDQQPKERPEQNRLLGGEQEDAPKQGEAEAIPQVEPQPAGAWLGVLSEPIDETLGVHLDLAAGCVLSYVAEDSPAAKAGLRRHDIIAQVDGGVIANQEELRDAIQGHKPGDEITLTVVSRGQKKESKVVLGERPAALPNPPGGGLPEGLPRLGEFELDGRFPELEDRLKELENLLPGGDKLHQQLDEHMKRFEKQLRKMEQGGGKLQLDLDFLDKLPKPQKGAFNLDLKSSSSFKFFDEEGSVEMKSTDGGKEVAVRDKGGNLLFEGPWDTPQDKAAAPKEIRERIEQMHDGTRFNFRLENLPDPKMEIPEENKPKLE